MNVPGPSRDEAPGSADSGPARSPARRLLEIVAGPHRHRRIRLLQWFTAGGVYAAAAALMATGIDSGWMRPEDLAVWSAFVACGLAFAYAALRSGWSEQLDDPALTQWQIALGIIAVSWGYLICGPVRTVALFPLLLIFAFGAFALEGRRIAVLAAFAAASLVAVTTLQSLNPSPTRDLPAADSARRRSIIERRLGRPGSSSVVARRRTSSSADASASRFALCRARSAERRAATTASAESSEA